MSIIKIPHTKDQTEFQLIDMKSCKRTQFQIDTLLEISKKEEFNQFVVCEDTNQLWIVFPEFEGPFVCLWYDTSNTLHVTKIGKTKILNDIVTK
ncbi:MAG: hypothetical protein ACXW2E_03130 [Nitrososphaeraceae archaeon]